MNWFDAGKEKPRIGVEVLLAICPCKCEVGEWDGEDFYETREYSTVMPTHWTYIEYPENEK